MRPIPKTYISLHDVSDLRAYVSPSPGSALELTIETPEGSMMIMLFMRSPDQPKALELAISTVMADKPPPAAACPVEKAAYKSQEEYWAALKRDLDARPIDRMVSELGKLQAGAPSPVDGKR